MRKSHVVVFPIPLQGHINPMMLLANQINSFGIRVTFLLPEKALSMLQNNKNTTTTTTKSYTKDHNNNMNLDIEMNHNGFAGGLCQLQCIDETYGISCQGVCGGFDSSVEGKKRAIHQHKVPYCNSDNTNHNTNEDNSICKSNVPNHNGTSVIIRINDHCTPIENHRSTINNKNFDDEGNTSDSGSGVDGGFGAANDDSGHDYDNGCIHACEDDVGLPIHFETLPDSFFVENQNFPMRSYVLHFLESMPLLKRKLEELLERFQQMGQPVTCIISDSFVPWTQDVANKFGIPRMEFWSSSITVYSMGYHIPQLVEKGYLPVHSGGRQKVGETMDIIPGLQAFQIADFFYDLHPLAIASPLFHLVCTAFSRAKEARRVLVNSFFLLEKDITEALWSEGVPILPIGPLLPLHILSAGHTCTTHHRSSTQNISASLYPDDFECLSWLDTQAESSVVYVSFGSLVCLSMEEMEELMLGLEGSHHPYLLVIRPDMVPGLLSSTAHNVSRGRGRVCTWAPQMHVLGHPAVGCFLTHCGWNSIMEGMYMGVPMIGCNRESEQHTNMKCLRDEWKVAIGLDYAHQQEAGTECKNNQMQGGDAHRVKIKKELVEGAIRAMMQEEEGVGLRKRMQSYREAAKHAAHESSSLRSLIHELKQS